MAKQLEMFSNLTQKIPQDELEGIKQLAASSDQANIDLCCTFLDNYNYTFIQKCVFVFEQQINTISLDAWVNAVFEGQPIIKRFSISEEVFIIEDAYKCSNKETHLTVEQDSGYVGAYLYHYDDWIGNEQKDRPTVKSRAIQVKKFEKVLKFWHHGNNK